MGLPDSSMMVDSWERDRFNSRARSTRGGRSDSPQKAFGTRRLGKSTKGMIP